MKRLIATLAVLSISAPALAALPPAYQRAAELKAVTDAATEVLNGAPIVSIEYILEDVYRAYSDGCSVTVLINPTPSADQMPGPRAFEAVADKPVCDRE